MPCFSLFGVDGPMGGLSDGARFSTPRCCRTDNLGAGRTMPRSSALSNELGTRERQGGLECRDPAREAGLRSPHAVRGQLCDLSCHLSFFTPKTTDKNALSGQTQVRTASSASDQGGGGQRPWGPRGPRTERWALLCSRPPAQGCCESRLTRSSGRRKGCVSRGRAAFPGGHSVKRAGRPHGRGQTAAWHAVPPTGSFDGGHPQALGSGGWKSEMWGQWGQTAEAPCPAAASSRAHGDRELLGVAFHS